VILVIGNSIRMAIENRRSEIRVVKLVGGTDTFVRRPFLYTGLWSGLLGGMLAWWLVEVALWWLSGPVELLAGLYNSDFSLLRLPFSGLLALLATAMGLGWLGAWLAVKRHLRLIEP
ncbi:MAG: FtsX-like permease family protein, partial [Oleiphilaceae bacterium]|nr:FtsX-like permease family protein [Oleiphilaceae bacterium]